MSRRPRPDINFSTFKDLAKKAFERASHDLLFPFKTPFGMDVHYVGEDDQFTQKVNKALPIIRPKIQAGGIQIPKNDIAVISVVRKSKAYEEESTSEPVWTIDRVCELPKTHPLVRDISNWTTAPDHKDLEAVKQWFLITRYQVLGEVRTPLLMMVFGYMAFSDDNVMEGICPIGPDAQKMLKISDKEMLQMQYQFAYECSESLRQIAALAYLEETPK